MLIASPADALKRGGKRPLAQFPNILVMEEGDSVHFLTQSEKEYGDLLFLSINRRNGTADFGRRPIADRYKKETDQIYNLVTPLSGNSTRSVDLDELEELLHTPSFRSIAGEEKLLFSRGPKYIRVFAKVDEPAPRPAFVINKRNGELLRPSASSPPAPEAAEKFLRKISSGGKVDPKKVRDLVREPTASVPLTFDLLRGGSTGFGNDGRARLAALAYLVNSLSWNPDPFVGDPSKMQTGTYSTDLGPFLAEQPLRKLLANNPYRCLENDPVRTDWFIAEVMKDPASYYAFLEMPDNLSKLRDQVQDKAGVRFTPEKKIALDVGESEIVHGNRTLSREGMEYDDGKGGYYASGDFKTSDNVRTTEKKNVFIHPTKADPDGFEGYFRLPNGFRAYWIANSDGKFLTETPTTVTNQPVYPPLSCLDCHAAGTRGGHGTEALERITKNAELGLLGPGESLDDAKKTFVKNSEYLADAKEDDLFFANATLKAKARVKEHGENLIPKIFAAYQKPVGFETLARELGVEGPELKDLLKKRPELLALLAPSAAATEEGISGLSVRRTDLEARHRGATLYCLLRSALNPTARIPDPPLGAHASDLPQGTVR